MNKKKKFVADGVFHAELHSFLTKALSTAGYSGIEVRVTPRQDRDQNQSYQGARRFGCRRKKDQRIDFPRPKEIQLSQGCR